MRHLRKRRPVARAAAAGEDRSLRGREGEMSGDTDRLAFARRYIAEVADVLRRLPLEDLARALGMLEVALVEGRYVFLAGNGGSAATASHMANDLLKGVAKDGRRGARAVALSDSVPLITAIANDEDYSEVFAGQLAALGQPGDLLIVLSASGNSPNVLRAVSLAREMRMRTIGLVGMGGGKVAKMCDVAVIVPSDDYGPVEDAHMVFNHLISSYLRGWRMGARGAEGS